MGRGSAVTFEAGHLFRYVRLLGVRLVNARGLNSATVADNETLFVEVEYETLRNATGLRIGATITTTDGTVLLSTKDRDELPEDDSRAPGRYLSRCELPANFFNYGQYFVSVGADFPMIQAHFPLMASSRFRGGGGRGRWPHPRQ